jgi:hypothetical protein
MGMSQENHYKMLLPRGFQDSSKSLLHFSNVLPLGDSIESTTTTTAVVVENDQMRARPPKSQWRGLKIL